MKKKKKMMTTMRRKRRRRKVDAAMEAWSPGDYVEVWKLNCIVIEHSADWVHHE